MKKHSHCTQFLGLFTGRCWRRQNWTAGEHQFYCTTDNKLLFIRLLHTKLELGSLYFSSQGEFCVTQTTSLSEFLALLFLIYSIHTSFASMCWIWFVTDRLSESFSAKEMRKNIMFGTFFFVPSNNDIWLTFLKLKQSWFPFSSVKRKDIILIFI